MTDVDGELLCLDLPHAEEVRAALPGPDELDALAVRAKALGDPTRLRVAAALATGGAMCGCDLAWVTGLTAGLVSHHVRALRAAGLATSRRDGRLRVYALTPGGSALLDAVVGPGVVGPGVVAPVPEPLPASPAVAGRPEAAPLPGGAR